MARPRTAPATPFGAWLDQWFKDHPETTFQAFADAVHVTKSAVSLWISNRKPVQVKPGTLRAIAEYTGTPLATFEQLVYGSTMPASPEPRISLSEAELEELLERAAQRAARMVLAERDRDG